MSQSPLPIFSIVIPAYVRMDLLERTVGHLLAQDYPADRFEIVIVDHDGGQAAPVAERLARPSTAPVRLFYCADRSAMAKRNLGARVSTGDYVLFHNDDIWSKATLLREHARTHLAHAPRPVAVLGHVDQSPEMPYSPFIEAYRPYAYDELRTRAEQPVHWWYFYAPNVSLPRQVMLDGGFFFREDWPELVHEDVELGYRWTRAGYDLVYNPLARADHFHPHTLSSAARLQESLGRHLPRLERLAPEPRLRERYGVFSWRNSPRSIARGLVRQALFNQVTLPGVERWLERQPRNTRLSRWLYWKVLLHYTNRGYRQGRSLYGAWAP
jgi:glycosyltransferase involved in cell wall biosynthesis